MKKIQKSERTREQLLEAAAEIFAEVGYAKASTRSIADRAGVAEGTIFRHFPTKRDLLTAVVGPLIEHVVAPLAAQSLLDVVETEHQTMTDLVEAIYDDRLKFIRMSARPLRILMQEVGVNEQLRNRLRSVVERVALPGLRQSLSRMKERGLLHPEVEPDQGMRMIVTTIAGYLFVRYVVAPDAQWDDAAERQATVSMLARALEA